MSLLRPRTVVHAHCDLPCGVYDPAQARYEAQSVKAMQEKYQQNEDPVYRTRCVIIIEQRSHIAKEHLWTLWTDYFKPEHVEKYPQIHDLFWRATKAAGATGTKGSMDASTATPIATARTASATGMTGGAPAIASSHASS